LRRFALALILDTAAVVALVAIAKTWPGPRGVVTAYVVGQVVEYLWARVVPEKKDVPNPYDI